MILPLPYFNLGFAKSTLTRAGRTTWIEWGPLAP